MILKGFIGMEPKEMRKLDPLLPGTSVKNKCSDTCAMSKIVTKEFQSNLLICWSCNAFKSAGSSHVGALLDLVSPPMYV